MAKAKGGPGRGVEGIPGRATRLPKGWALAGRPDMTDIDRFTGHAWLMAPDGTWMDTKDIHPGDVGKGTIHAVAMWDVADRLGWPNMNERRTNDYALARGWAFARLYKADPWKHRLADFVGIVAPKVPFTKGLLRRMQDLAGGMLSPSNKGMSLQFEYWKSPTARRPTTIHTTIDEFVRAEDPRDLGVR